jgi:hypothetical protein
MARHGRPIGRRAAPTLSAASSARRPRLRPGAALAVLLSAFIGVALSIEVAAFHLFGVCLPPSLQVAVLVVAYEIATGSVLVGMARARLVGDRASFLAGYQRAEYRKNAVIRLGWSALGALEQVPGAFAGVRAESFREAGGFPTDSLTEDYELAYRLVQRSLCLERPRADRRHGAVRANFHRGARSLWVGRAARQGLRLCPRTRRSAPVERCARRRRGSLYSGRRTPEPPISCGMSFCFGSPSRTWTTDSP